MANWSNPLITSTYTSVLDDLKNRDLDAAVMFNPSIVTPTNVPTGAIRWNPSTGRFERYSGTAWTALISQYLIDVDTLDGQHGAHYLDWNNLTNKPTTFAPSAHNHDAIYYTETEADARFSNKLVVSGNTVKLQTPGNADLSTITVPYATNAGNATTVGGFNVNQNLQSIDSPSFVDLTLTGNLRASGGSQTTPSLTFAADTDTGLFRPAENNLGFSTQGTERMRITSGGRLGIGTTSPAYSLEVFGTIGGTHFAGDPYINLRRANGTTAAPSAVQANDILGYFTAAGYGSTNFSGAVGGMLVQAAQNFTDAAQGTKVHFQTTPTGSTSRVTRMTIDSAGLVGINTTNPAYQLDVNGSFNATSLAIGKTAITATAAEINKLDGVTSVTADLNLLSGAAAAGVTATRVQYLNSLTSNVQTQLNARLTTASPSFTGTMDGPSLRLTTTGDLSLTSTGHAFQIGVDTGANLAIDVNEIQARNNQAGAALYLNTNGGDVGIGSSTSTIRLNGGVALVKATDDTPGAPSYTWNSNTGLGMYRASSSSIGWSIAGVNAMTLNSTNLLVGGDVVARLYTGSTAGWTDFPIGHVLAVYSSTNYNRNESFAVRLDDANSTFYEQGTGSGALTGTWRSRGKIYGSDMYIMQRVA